MTSQIVDLSVNEMMTIDGGDKLTCLIDGAAFAAGVLTGGLAGWVGAAWAWNDARNAGCFNEN